jgi:AcrR family transcriptional regulator
MTTRSADKRDLLLQAALGILLEGEGILTLDAVVKRSGVSKGGLMHHFPTREALVEGVVGEIINQFRALAEKSGPPAAVGTPEETRSYVDSSLEPAMREASADMARGLVRLYGSDFRRDTPFLDPWRKLFASRLDQFREKEDLDGFAKAAVVTLAMECFIMIDVFSLYRFSDTELEAIKQELLSRSSR